MAAGFLITRILLVLLLGELDCSSAFPRAWQGEIKKEEYGYGNRRPLQYVRSLRQPQQNLQPNVHDQVRVRTWQKPKAQIQIQPRVYHQTQSPDQPWSDVATRGTQEVSPSRYPSQRDYPLFKPRSFEFNLKIPFAHFLGQKKETSSNTKGSDLSSGGSDGAGHNSQSYKPTSVQINSGFTSPSDSDGLSGKGSTDDPNGGKSAHEVSKPSFQLSLSVPIPPTKPSPKPASSHGGHFANLKRPESVGFVQNSYTEPSEPQSSSMQSGSKRIFSNSASAVQQQTQHQTFEPVQTKYTEGIQMTFLPGHASQPATPISQVKIPTEQSLVFPVPSATSLPNSQYPLQSENVNSAQTNSAQIKSLSQDYGKAQSGQTVSSDQTNVHLSLSPSQYERVQSGQYSAVQVQPSGNNYGQRQIWQPVSTPPTFLLEHASQPATPISQVKTPAEQSLVFPVPSAPSLPNSQYPLQSEDVNSGYYNAQINSLSKDYGKAQSGQTVSSDQTNVHLSLSPSQYERVQSGQYSAVQVQPSGNNYDQRQIWQPVSTPPTFASEQCNNGQFKPSFAQMAPYLSPVYPSSPTVAPSQYELPSSHQVATTNYYGTGNVAQMVPTDFSSAPHYQDSGDQSGHEALPDHVTAPSPNFQSLPTDYQTQMSLPGQYNERGQLNGKPKYTQLFIDEDEIYQYTSNPYY